MSLNTKKSYLCNGFGQQEISNLILGICFKIYTSRINTHLEEIQIDFDDP